MHFQLPTILALLPLILAAPLADHLGADVPTPTFPTPTGEVSILPLPNPVNLPIPAPTPSATLQDLLAFCASGSAAANLPTVQQFCKLLTGFTGAAGGITGGGGLTGILPPLQGIAGVPTVPGLPLPANLPAGLGPLVPT